MTQRIITILAAMFVCLAGFGEHAEAQTDDQIAAIAGARLAYIAGDSEAAGAVPLPAAEAGDANAQNIVGGCIQGGNGVPRNPVTALAWYEKSVAQGFAKAEVNLGTLLLHGDDGIAPDQGRAAQLFQAAMAQGYAHAIFERGLMHRDGQGGAADPAATKALIDAGL